ncbi:MAG: AtpZ/AtpI family protein [Chloroflexi bacterium]|nr:AtpZ/AtpI family protein [Chloroflexota bacterium]
MDKWVVAARLMGIGWYIGLCVAGGILGGIWVDNKLGTSIVFTLVGIVLGTAVALYGTYRMISPLIREGRGNDDNGD